MTNRPGQFFLRMGIVWGQWLTWGFLGRMIWELDTLFAYTTGVVEESEAESPWDFPVIRGLWVCAIFVALSTRFGSALTALQEEMENAMFGSLRKRGPSHRRRLEYLVQASSFLVSGASKSQIAS